MEEAFKKFDTDGNRILDAEEQARMLKALEDEKVNIMTAILLPRKQYMDTC